MEFIFDKKEFESKFFQKGKFSHAIQNSSIKVFPFTTKEEAPETNAVVSGYFCNSVGEIRSLLVSHEELLKELVGDGNKGPELNIEEEYKPVFRKVLKESFFHSDYSLRQEGIQTLLLKNEISDNQDTLTRQKEKAAQKVGAFLWDVLGSNQDREILKSTVRTAENQAEEECDVLQSYFFEILKAVSKVTPIQKSDYYQVVSILDQPFKEDLLYLLSQNSLNSTTLKRFFNLYYFTYLAQTILQLDSFLSGKTNVMKENYFCVSWEKISQSRECVKQGWDSLKQASLNMFPHMITLMILNMIEQPDDQPRITFDYVTLNRLIHDKVFDEQQVLEQIRVMTDTYRNSITDSEKMRTYERDPGQNTVNGEIKYLFESVKRQFADSGRSGVPERYAGNFKNAAAYFLVAHGRLGNVLTVDQEMLLFLVSLVIKTEETMRLNQVFTELQKRGIYFDYRSKEEIEAFLEKLNLIEKKSDSGDAKYVRSIL